MTSTDVYSISTQINKRLGGGSGGGLALCGLVLQAILRNPLVEPYLLGISAGASLGAVCVMLLGNLSGAIL